MAAKSSWNSRFPLATYLYFLPFCNFQSRQPPLPPSSNVEEKDEHVARHVMHFSNSFLNFHSFYNHITTLYRGGEGVHQENEHGVPTLLAGIVVRRKDKLFENPKIQNCPKCAKISYYYH